MNYSHYTLQDFLNDEFFMEWVNDPSPECRYFWDNWVARHPEQTKVIAMAREIAGSLDYKNKYLPGDNDKVETLENILREKPGKGSVYSRSLKVAAAAILAIGLSLFYHSYQQRASAPQQAMMIKKRTSLGEKKTIMLPDSTFVKLNSGSELTYTVPFENKAREVNLTGEAFFEVARNVEKPFIITTGKVKTTVLGTSFDLKAYQDEEDITVVVTSGKVQVQRKDEGSNLDGVVLLPNEKVTLHKARGKMVKEACDPDDLIAWKDGKLVFRKAGFSEVLSELEKWYGVQIIRPEGLEVPGRFSGEFVDKSLQKVLDGLSFSHLISYELNGKIVTLSESKNEQ